MANIDPSKSPEQHPEQHRAADVEVADPPETIEGLVIDTRGQPEKPEAKDRGRREPRRTGRESTPASSPAASRARLEPLDQVDGAARHVTREDYLRVVSKRLMIVTLSMLLLIVVGTFGLTLAFDSRFPLSWFSFGLGVLGGFVSLQQRLSRISDRELFHLRYSWVNVLVLPVFGGVFALLFYIITLSGVLSGDAFPAYTIPRFSDPATTDDLRRFFTETYPATGGEFAKLALWAFTAGFSERLVPDILTRNAAGVPTIGSDGGSR